MGERKKYENVCESPFLLACGPHGFLPFFSFSLFQKWHDVVHLALVRDVTNEGVPRFQVFSIKIRTKGRKCESRLGSSGRDSWALVLLTGANEKQACLTARHRRRKRTQVWTLGERLFRGRQANLRETHVTHAICLFRPCCGLASLNRSAAASAAAAVVPLAASGSLN